MEFMVAFTLTRFPGPLEENSPTTSQNVHLHHTYIQDIFGIGIRLSVGCRKAKFLFHLTKKTVPGKVPVVFS